MSDCIFCKIVKGEIPSTKIFENETVIGFKDLRPQAKIHQLFIHKSHTKDINDLAKNDPKELSDVFNAIRTYTINEGLVKDGFRVVTNLGPNAGQTVFHTHFHVLAGEPLGHFGS
ncbi:histidine triad nucleotide-binding protein [Peredibacter sp. HCB2-198]|uniref:histidine triad nucleotide-binding protein n=1 Tax=Peredibacter sp. HCB2-198 TaxID=3383025 RepID=UPI0038B4A42F